MSKPAVLITAIGGDIGQSIARALGGARHRLVVTDARPVLLPRRLAHRFHQIAPADRTSEYFQDVGAIVRKEKIRFFIPVSEPEIGLLSRHRGELSSLRVRTLLNNQKTVECFSDKLKTAEHLAAIGVRAPETFLLERYDGRLGFPLIVKARFSCGSRRRWIVQKPLDLEHVSSQDDGTFIAQEYLGSDDEEYTTGIFSDGRKVSSITFRRRLGFGGISAEATLADEPFLEELAETVAASVDLFGSINVQSRKVGREFIPFEINPRLSSTLLFRKRFGFDDCRWWMNALAGKPYRYRRLYRSGRCIRHLTESYLEMKRVR